MRDEWVGDIGDLGKYGLLRVLTGYPDAPEGERLKLGVVWYYNRDVPDAALDAKIKGSWGDLYRKLQELRHSERRTVAHVKCSEILPDKTAYYVREVCRGKDAPDDWLKGALRCTSKAQLVLLDPDNGLAGPDSGNKQTLQPWHKDGLKYTFVCDIQSFLDAGKSLVIYHHLGRHKGKKSQINDLATNLQSTLDKKPELALSLRSSWFHPERAFFIIAQKDHHALLRGRLDSLLKSDWGKPPNPHFEEIRLS